MITQNIRVKYAVSIEAVCDRQPDRQKHGDGGAGKNGDHDGDLILDGGKRICSGKNDTGHHAGQGHQADGCHGGDGRGKGGPQRIPEKRIHRFCQCGPVCQRLVIRFFVCVDGLIEIVEPDDVRSR